MIYYVYLIKTLDGYLNKSYVGYTTNLKKRLDKHNSNQGAKSTKGYMWHLIYKKKFYSKSKALSYEYSLKKNRTKRKDLINKFNNKFKK